MKRYCIVIIFSLTITALKAQFDAQFSQYWVSQNYFNGASVGESKGINASLINRQQWVGMPGAPKSLYIGLDMPIFLFGKSHGIGLTVFSDQLGAFTNSNVLLDYAYKLNLYGGVLSIGAQFGLVNQGVDGTKLSLKDFTDPAHSSTDDAIPTTSVQAMSFDMGLGAYYVRKNAYVGLSVTHLMEPTLSLDEKVNTYIGRIMYLTGGYSYPLEGVGVDLLPSFLAKTDFRVIQLDLTLRGELNKKFCGGLTYRWNQAVVALIGVKLKNISLGYSYDISTSKLFNVTGGSHEFFASYNFELLFPQNGKRKTNKSLRYL